MDHPVRNCGECIACCAYLKIPVLEKKGLEHCRHLDLLEPVRVGELQLSAGCNSCKIHETKPDVCKDYECLWLKGYGEGFDRPDKVLILVDETNRIENAIECKPLSEGAADTPKGRRAIRRMSRQSNRVALVTTFHETRLVRVVGRPD